MAHRRPGGGASAGCTVLVLQLARAQQQVAVQAHLIGRQQHLAARRQLRPSARAGRPGASRLQHRPAGGDRPSGAAGAPANSRSSSCGLARAGHLPGAGGHGQRRAWLPVRRGLPAAAPAPARQASKMRPARALRSSSARRSSRPPGSSLVHLPPGEAQAQLGLGARAAPPAPGPGPAARTSRSRRRLQRPVAPASPPPAAPRGRRAPPGGAAACPWPARPRAADRRSASTGSPERRPSVATACSSGSGQAAVGGNARRIRPRWPGERCDQGPATGAGGGGWNRRAAGRQTTTQRSILSFRAARVTVASAALPSVPASGRG